MEASSSNCRDSFVRINEYWDRMSKVLILIVDAGLNWYFLRVVKKRLLEHYGLVKYKPLINFNAKLMVVSILMDVSWFLPTYSTSSPHILTRR